MTEAAGSLHRRARALMERVHRGGDSLAGEYPLVFADGCPGDFVTVLEDGELRAACAVLVRDLLVAGESLRVGLIGSVATEPAHRGRGFGGRLLEAAERRLAEEGCLAAFLWADEAAFYTRRGWREAGCETVHALCDDGAPELPAPGAAVVRAAAGDDAAALQRLYCTHAARVDRTLEETCALLAGPEIVTLVLERGHDIDAYACLGRGADLARCVHEWAGPPEDVLALVREHHARLVAAGAPGAVFLMGPGHATRVRARLDELGAPPVTGILALGKLLDPPGAAERIRNAAHGTLDVRIERDDGATLVGPKGQAELDTADLFELLFAARGERTAAEACERATGATLPDLPLPVYLWGLDSI